MQVGDNFNNLEVLEIRYINNKKHAINTILVMKCKCGSIIERNLKYIRDKNLKSCGCYKKEVLGKNNKTHGMSNSDEYRIYKNIKNRCCKEGSQDYANYGGKGITLYVPWQRSFEEFYNYLGPRPSKEHSVERIENTKGYEPGNIKWATRLEQGNNKSTNRVLKLNGESKTIAEWTRITGLKRHIIVKRLKLGWSVEKTLTTPARKTTLTKEKELYEMYEPFTFIA